MAMAITVTILVFLMFLCFFLWFSNFLMVFPWFPLPRARFFPGLNGEACPNLQVQPENLAHPFQQCRQSPVAKHFRTGMGGLPW